MSIFLSLIKDRVASQNYWVGTSGNPYKSDDISKVKDNIGTVNIPVTSIPSPFAQMHLFDAAFEYINREARTQYDRVRGETVFHHLISKCLDVYELLFSADELGIRNRIRLDIWDRKSLESLKKSYIPGQAVYGETLEIFLNDYGKEQRFQNSGLEKDPFSQIMLISVGPILIAGTSPYTGFFTTGNSISFDFKKLDGKSFFQEPVPLCDRDIKFQRFLHDLLNHDGRLISCFTHLKAYLEINSQPGLINDSNFIAYLQDIRSGDVRPEIHTYKIFSQGNQQLELLPGIPYRFNEISDTIKEAIVGQSDYRVKSNKGLEKLPLALAPGMRNPSWSYLKGPMSENLKIPSTPTEISFSDRVLPGTEDLRYPYLVRNDFLTKYMMRVDYEINSDKFWAGGNERINNIIPPIKPEYFEFFTFEDLKNNLQIESYQDGQMIQVTLRIPVQANNGQGYIEFRRDYFQYDNLANFQVEDEEKGAIIESEIYMGIYPFFKVTQSDKQHYNDLYKFLIYHPDYIEQATCTPYRFDGQVSVLNPSWISRTRKEEGLGVVSNYMDLSRDLKEDSDITFDFIQLSITKEGASAAGVLVPKLKEVANLSDKKVSLAFDVGTSNTFVAYRASSTAEPRPLHSYDKHQDVIQPHLVFLHHPRTEGDLSGTAMFDFNYTVGLSGYGAQMEEFQLNEFLPSLIGDKDTYNFPLRTIIMEDNDTDSTHWENVKLLSNINIPFAFNDFRPRAGYDDAISNLKWGIADQGNRKARTRIRAFIEQLALMGRNRLLADGSDPATANVIWFKPLSMGSAQTIELSEIWKDVFVNYFSKNRRASAKLNVLTESWAPYYSQESPYGSSDTYVNIDIGGGTTDILVFEREAISFTTSFRFAGNNLFDNGLQTHLRKDNGFVTKYRKKMETIFEEKEDYVHLDISKYIFDSDSLSSEDLVSFYFSTNEFREQLRLDQDFRLLFLLHITAVFYHAAQVMKIKGLMPPKNIGLSGNGANFLIIANTSEDLNRPRGISYLTSQIFQFVFAEDLGSKSVNIGLDMLPDPKAATCYGGIRGFNEMINSSQKTADIDNYYIPIGDDQTWVKGDDNVTKNEKFGYEKLNQNGDKYKKAVAANYTAFITFFFDKLWLNCDFPNNFSLSKDFSRQKLMAFFLNEDEIQSAITSSISHKMKREGEEHLSETMFFYPIKPNLYELSKILADPNQIGRFKRG